MIPLKVQQTLIKQDFGEVTTSLEVKISNLISENLQLKENQCQSETKISRLTDRIISLESHLRRDNLKFLNIKTQNEGQNDDCESIVLSLCNDMNILMESKDIVRAHRAGPKMDGSQLVIVKFHHFKDKLCVLKSKNRFHEIGIPVVEDFPVEVLERRKTFASILKAAYDSSGKYRVRLVMKRLLLIGRMFSTDNIGDLPSELMLASTSTITRNDITAFFTFKSPL